MPENGNQVHIPTVLWAQREDLVYLTVAVEDIEKPEIKLEANNLVFKGSSGSNTYELNLDFFKPVDKEGSKYGIYGQKHWMFIIKKQEKGPYWPRLLKDTKKVHWLKADWNKWKDEDDEEEEDPGMGGMGGMGGMDMNSMFQSMGGLGGLGGLGGMDMGGMGMGGMGGMGGEGLPNLDDMDDKEEDSDDEKLPDLEENKPADGEAKPTA